MRNPLLDKLMPLVQQLFPEQAESVCQQIIDLIVDYQSRHLPTQQWVNQRDVMLISYGDSILAPNEKPLRTLYHFMCQYMGDIINSLHILPCFPYSSDDGFSVEDYKQINPELGDWDDIAVLASEYDVMLDAVINHISRWSYWFRRYLGGDPDYQDFFIEADLDAEYQQVIRPRSSPLLTEFDTSSGKKWLWTTFSDDQIDLNFRNPKVMMAILDVLCYYAEKGSRFIRLDAVGFLWKRLGTSCMHLPETHAAIQLMRVVLDNVAPGTILITETNVPHEDNISYFGNGYDEAKMVYQFPLPPLVMHSFLTEDSTVLNTWADSLHPLSRENAFFNFLASHDGIGMRPTEGLLDEQQRQALVDHCLVMNGRVSYRTRGYEQIPYELNISYLDALAKPNDDDDARVKKMLAAHGILFSLSGVPAIYIHSLLGSENDVEGMEKSGINRRINRAKLNFLELEKELKDHNSLRAKIFYGLQHLIQQRKHLSAFAPRASQRILKLHPSVFAVERYNRITGGHVLALINLSAETFKLETEFAGVDVLTNRMNDRFIELEPWQVSWIKMPNRPEHYQHKPSITSE